MKIHRLTALLSIALLVVTLYVLMKPKSTYAVTCDVHSSAGWYPATYSYSTSTINLFGQTSNCWNTNNTYYDKAYSQASQYPGVPLNKIRAFVTGWEQVDGVNCTTAYTSDSGWKYNVSSATAINATRSYQCQGTNSHYYLSYTTHYFGDSSQATTGHK